MVFLPQTAGWNHRRLSRRVFGMRISSCRSVLPLDTIKLWAERTAPWILDWIDQHGNSTESTDSMAGCALQILFVLITRTKSLDCVDNELQRVNRMCSELLVPQGREACESQAAVGHYCGGRRSLSTTCRPRRSGTNVGSRRFGRSRRF